MATSADRGSGVNTRRRPLIEIVRLNLEQKQGVNERSENVIAFKEILFMQIFNTYHYLHDW